MIFYDTFSCIKLLNFSSSLLHSVTLDTAKDNGFTTPSFFTVTSLLTFVPNWIGT